MPVRNLQMSFQHVAYYQSPLCSSLGKHAPPLSSTALLFASFPLLSITFRSQHPEEFGGFSQTSGLKTARQRLPAEARQLCNPMIVACMHVYTCHACAYVHRSTCALNMNTSAYGCMHMYMEDASCRLQCLAADTDCSSNNLSCG